MPDKYPLPKIAGHLPLINLKNAASILKHPEVPNAKPSNKPPQAAADVMIKCAVSSFDN